MRSVRVPLALVCLFVAMTGGARAEVLNIIQTTITSAQTDLDVDHSYSWTFSVAGPLSFDSIVGKFTLKIGSQASEPAVLELQAANGAFQPTSLIASVAVPASAATQSFAEIVFPLTSTSTSLNGNYLLTLESNAGTTANKQWFIKDPTSSVVFENNTGTSISGFSGGGAVPVPEPASWAGALVAVACAGGYLARRRSERRST